MLGVTSTSSAAEVEQAFRVAARRCHPDTGGHAGAFRAVAEARTVMLTSPAPHPVDRVVDVVVRYHPLILLADVVARAIDRHLVRAPDGRTPAGDPHRW